MTKLERHRLREAFSEFHYRMGCSCCADTEGLAKQEAVIAEILGFPAYSDNSGFDFTLPESTKDGNNVE